MAYQFDAIARHCATAGIRHVFGITGSGNSLALINALADHDVDYYPVSHEAAAGLMAGGACFDGRCRAAAVTIKGPGFANLLPAMLSNRYEMRPALSISEAYPASVPAQQMHKRLDHARFAEQFVKQGFRMDADGAVIHDAQATAQSEVPGPCHIDLAATPAEYLATAAADPEPEPQPVVEETALARALDLILTSKRPVLVLGSWAMRSPARRDWTTCGVPVVTTAAAKGSVNEAHPLFAGIMTGEASEYSPENNLLKQADLIVAVGLRNTEVIRPLPFPCPLIMIDGIPVEAPEGFAPALTLVASDGNHDVLGNLASALTDKSWGETRTMDWRSRVDNWVLQDDWQAGNVFQLLNAQRIDGKALRLVLDTGFFCTVGETVWRCAQAGDAVGSGAGRFMGVAIPTAIGLAIADRTRAVACVVGDGGVGPYLAETQVAVSASLPILFVHMSDGGFGSVAAFADSSDATIRATACGATGWTGCAESMGMMAATIDNAAALQRTVSAWNPSHGPIFLTLRFEPNRYREIARALR